MATSTTTSIQLREGDEVGSIRSEVQPTPEDEIAALSQAADSAVPEGGYGWVVVTCCAIIMFFFTGLNYSWGVAQAALVEQGTGSASTLAFVGSVDVTCIAAFAIINARVLRVLGARKTALLGIGLEGLGMFLASFTTHNIAGLFITVGGISGIGTR
jgi:hypothetical protein